MNLSIDITNKCNNHCYYCCNRDKLGNPDNIDLNFIKKLFKDLDDNKNDIKIALKGGEPLPMPPEFLDFFSQTNRKLILFTNLNINLTEKHLRLIKNVLYVRATFHYKNNEELFLKNLRLIKDIVPELNVNIIIEPRFFKNQFSFYLKHHEEFEIDFAFAVYPEFKRDMLIKKFRNELDEIIKFQKNTKMRGSEGESEVQDKIYHIENPNKIKVYSKVKFGVTENNEIIFICGYKHNTQVNYDDFIKGKYNKIVCNFKCTSPGS